VEALKFFRRPTIRQYFHKGLLWRSSESGEVASFELFIDLIYVGVIDIIGEKALEDPDGLSLLQFVIVFCIGRYSTCALAECLLIRMQGGRYGLT